MKLIRIFSFCFIVILHQMMQSCEVLPTQEIDNTPTVRSFTNVDQRLWSFFEEFENEAAERGFTFDLNQHNLTGNISDIHDDGVAGSCSYGFRQANRVTIDMPFWDRAGYYSREMVVFHELGHCVLGRDHSEELTNNGFCASIMRSGTGNCQTLYNAQNKEYYLNELFETLTP